MNHQAIYHLQTIFSHISTLPFHILDSASTEFTCLDNGLRKQFKNNTQMYDNLYALLTRDLSPDTILHLEDAFGLHYVAFQPFPTAILFCVLGPFVDKSLESTPHFVYLQQTPIFSEASVASMLDVAQNALALLSKTTAASIRELHLFEDPALSLQLSADLHQKTSPVIQQLIYYIQTHLHQKLTLQSLSDHFGFSPTYISHHFKNDIGLPPMQYIIRQRLLHAQYLLRTTSVPIKEIADAVGVPDCSYFIKLFREHVGSTPSEYRNLHK